MEDAVDGLLDFLDAEERIVIVARRVISLSGAQGIVGVARWVKSIDGPHQPLR